jgi:hypothetical protein
MADEHYVVFYTPRWERPLAEWLAALSPGTSVTLFELEPRVPQSYHDRFPCVTYEHFLSEADFDAIDQRALALAQSWYLVDGADVTADTAGISLGKLVEYDIVIPLVAALKHLTVIQAILAREGPVTFVCFDRRSVVGQTLDALVAQSPLRVDWPSASQKAEPAPASGQRALMRQARPWLRLALQSVLVSLAAARRVFRRQAATKPCRILFYSSFHQYLDYLKGVVAADFADVFIYNPVVLSWSELLSLKVNLLLDRPPLVMPGWTAAPWRARWAALRAQPQFTARFQTGGLPLWPLAEPILAEQFEKRFAELANLRQRLAAVLRRCRPDLVVVPQDVHDTPRLLVMLAQAAGIPTLATEHGVIANYPHRVLPMADKIALWGRGDIAYYLRHGYHPDRFVVIGQPVLERLWGARNERLAPGTSQTPDSSGVPLGSDDAAASAPGPGKSSVILFAAQPFVPLSARNSPVETAELIRVVIDACRGRPDWQLIIKLHPLMDGNELTYLDTSGVNMSVVRGGSIYAMLAEADVLVTWSSTAGLEGMVMGKPLIALQTPGKRDYVPYVAAGAALGATTPAELTEAIERVLAGADDTAARRTNVAAFIRDHVETIDDAGGALHRFVGLAREMIGLL